MTKNIGSNIAIVVGILLIVAGLSQLKASSANAGLIMLIGAFAYRSAKKRYLGEVKNTSPRKVVELIGMLIIVLLIVLQKDLIDLLATDPVPNLIVPLWALIAYIIVFIKKQQT